MEDRITLLEMIKAAPDMALLVEELKRTLDKHENAKNFMLWCMKIVK